VAWQHRVFGNKNLDRIARNHKPFSNWNVGDLFEAEERPDLLGGEPHNFSRQFGGAEHGKL
jgi:hypothetical protein